MSRKTRVVIVGAGGHGHVMLDVLRQQPQAEVVGFLDDRRELWGTTARGGCPVLGGVDFTSPASEQAEAFVVAVGNNEVRARLFAEGLAAGLTPWNAVHPSLIMAASVELGEGAQVVAGVVINPFAVIGRNVILNTACSVDHDCRIGDHAFIAPGVHMGGEVTIEELAFIGIGASVLPGVRVGRGAVVGGGAMVVRDVPPNVTVVGVPARAR